MYLTAADASGMMVSFIQSNYLGFGSGIVIPETGISMNNRGLGFTLEAGHYNQVAGNKFPFHTIIPGFLMRDHQPLMSFGVMGGHMQAQGHVQILVRLCDYQQNPQTAIDAPRWYISPDLKISIESGIKPQVLAELAERGHTLVPAETSIFGGAQAIYKLKDGYFAASTHGKMAKRRGTKWKKQVFRR